MLLPSDRHTAPDLKLWAEYEEADRLFYEAGRVRAVAAVRAGVAVTLFAQQGPCYCSVSWGKDSVVTADVVLRARPTTPLVHLRVTPSHSPHCDDVRDAFLRRWPAARYEEIPVDYGDVYARRLTDDEQDRETDRLWFDGFRRAAERFGPRYILGIRADESGGRAIRLRKWGLSGPTSCAPIGWWKARHVFAYLAGRDLPVHPNYAMLGGGRWERDRLRVAELGDTHGRQFGRAEWEAEYYPDVVRRLAAGR